MGFSPEAISGSFTSKPSKLYSILIPINDKKPSPPAFSQKSQEANSFPTFYGPTTARKLGETPHPVKCFRKIFEAKLYQETHISQPSTENAVGPRDFGLESRTFSTNSLHHLPICRNALVLKLSLFFGILDAFMKRVCMHLPVFVTVKQIEGIPAWILTNRQPSRGPQNVTVPSVRTTLGPSNCGSDFRKANQSRTIYLRWWL